MIFVDTNVLIDVFNDDPNWAGWSGTQLVEAGRTGPIVVNMIVIAEIARDFGSIDQLRTAVAQLRVGVVDLDDVSAFNAGQRFADYRRSRETSEARRVLPDFMIGAHAYTLGVPLLTRDSAIYRRYFPDLTLITPETHPDG